jgi:hypothetical protein
MKLLIAILSCHKNVELRSAQRETWLQNCSVDYRYFIGRPEPETPESNTVYLDVTDDYDSLTYKTQALCRWIITNTTYTHMVKCDDDTYIYVD